MEFSELQIESKSSLSLEVTERISTNKLDRRTLTPGAHNTCFKIEAGDPLVLKEFRIWRSKGAGFRFEGVLIESINK